MRHRAFTASLLTGLLLLSVAAATASWAEDCTPWCSTIETPQGGALALVDASWQVDVLGAVAVGKLVQSYRNPGEEPVQASYRYEAPTEMKVTSLAAVIDGETVELMTPQKSATGSGRGSKNARGASAKAKGARTFTVEPESTIEVEAVFQMRLPLKGGTFRLSLPAVRAAGLEDAFEQPSSLVAVRVHHEDPLAHVDSKSHELLVSYEGDLTLIEVADPRGLEGRTLELEFAMGLEDEATLLGYVGPETKGQREVLAVLTPPSKPRVESIRPKRVVFVLDTSGSMGKGKLDLAREALYAALEKMTPEDLLNIVEFDSDFTMMNPEPVKTTSTSEAIAWLEQLRPGGSTRLLPALAAAFEQPQGLDHHAMIVVLTDGAVQDPLEVEALLQQKLGDSRLFIVGIGEDVKQDAIYRFAEQGRGTAAFSKDPDGLEAALAELFESISQPIAWDLELEWDGGEVEVLKPSRLPDLYAGRPVTIVGRTRGEVPTVLRVRGTTMDGERTFRVELEPSELALPQLAPVSESQGKAPAKR